MLAAPTRRGGAERRSVALARILSGGVLAVCRASARRVRLFLSSTVGPKPPPPPKSPIRASSVSLRVSAAFRLAGLLGRSLAELACFHTRSGVDPVHSTLGGRSGAFDTGGARIPVLYRRSVLSLLHTCYACANHFCVCSAHRVCKSGGAWRYSTHDCEGGPPRRRPVG